ncbi:hypothetical protein BDD43_0565 [Mucilaginibacter gracilis]|uniref:Uncharacterized protein n=2 Tax=Sphingobacteriaceae TaxID=84566 RepID=A0A495IUM7_9SPHI|nr:hypothetical protein BDD43_0565 [Mucilaginibacter gracilis]
MIHHFRRGDFELNPVKEFQNEFKSDMGMLDFQIDNQGQNLGFKLSGDRVRNIRFRKITSQK